MQMKESVEKSEYGKIFIFYSLKDDQRQLIIG